MHDPRTERVPERVGPVAGPFIGQHPLHRDAAGFEVRVGPLPEPGRGLLGLIIQDPGLRQPRMVIHRVVQVGVARPPVRLGPGLVAPGSGPAQHQVAAAVGNAPELLDVHVD